MTKMREELQADLTRALQKMRINEARLSKLDNEIYQHGSNEYLSAEYNREYELNWTLAEHIEDLKTALSMLRD